MFHRVKALFIVLTVLYPVIVRSDPLPAYYWFGEINSLNQNEQDILVNIHAELTYKKALDDTIDDDIDDDNWWDDDEEVRVPFVLGLWRINATENKELLSQRTLYVDGNFIGAGYCQSGADNSSCAEHPENCDDCNGDGTPECEKFYCDRYDLEVMDACVPPGMADYHVSSPYGDCFDQISILVETIVLNCGEWNTVDPNDDPCLSIDDDLDDADDDLDDNVDDVVDDVSGDDNDASDDDGTGSDEGGSGGCSVSADGATASLALSMFLIGLAAMTVTGRKKSEDGRKNS